MSENKKDQNQAAEEVKNNKVEQEELKKQSKQAAHEEAIKNTDPQ